MLFIANILVLRFSHEYKVEASGNSNIVDTVFRQPLASRFVINNVDLNSNMQEMRGNTIL